MESRNISLTLEKAREWYNSGNADLKEVALQAYTKDELKTPEWQKIKTFEGACRAIGIVYRADCDLNYLSRVEGDLGKHLTAIYKMDIIRKALNGDWKPSLVQGDIYYPYVRFYPADESKEAAIRNNWSLGPSFYAEGKKYTLVSGDYACNTCYTSSGLTNFGCGFGIVQPILGLLGCKNRKIAEHMSRYFSKEIFEAAYAYHEGTYQWV